MTAAMHGQRRRRAEQPDHDDAATAPPRADREAGALLALQRTAGNAAVGRLVAPIQRARFSDAQPKAATAPGGAGGGAGLEPAVRRPLERFFGTGFSDVRVHASSPAAPELGAAAYTQGADIHFAPGRFDPGSDRGQRLIAHELAHVVQQRQGRVATTGEQLGLPVNDDPSLERESDGAASAFVDGRARLARVVQFEFEDEQGYRGLQNAKEKEQYVELRNREFEQGQIKGAGAKGANADLVAYDRARLWIMEVKGTNLWQSRDNQTATGNVPAKQVYNALAGRFNKTIKATTLLSPERPVDIKVGDYVYEPIGQDGRSQLVIAVTGLNFDDAILEVHLDPLEGDGKVAGNDYEPHTLTEIINWLAVTVPGYRGSSTHVELGKKTGEVMRIKESWESHRAPDARSWFMADPESAAELEEIYQLARRTHPSDNRFDKLKQDVEVRLLPVLKALPEIQKTRFGKDTKAADWLKTQRAKNAGETDDVYLNAILGADTTYGVAPDLAANLVVLKRVHNRAVKAAKTQAKSVNTNTAPSRKRTVTTEIWNHIGNGELKSDGVPKGFHTLTGERPVARTDGARRDHPHGCYWSKVVSSTDPTKVKPDGSTFFPTAWTRQDIVDAIEYASEVRRGQLYETTKEAKTAGLQLWCNGDSYFPYFG
jgi:hypothetical protein